MCDCFFPYPLALVDVNCYCLSVCYEKSLYTWGEYKYKGESSHRTVDVSSLRCLHHNFQDSLHAIILVIFAIAWKMTQRKRISKNLLLMFFEWSLIVWIKQNIVGQQLKLKDGVDIFENLDENPDDERSTEPCWLIFPLLLDRETESVRLPRVVGDLSFTDMWYSVVLAAGIRF